jgi:ribonuclease D
MDYPKSISKEEINTLPLLIFKGKIELIDTNEKALKAAEALKNERLLGFDTETRPSFNKGESYALSLLQLSTEHNAYLFRLGQITLPQTIIDLLSDESVTKAGVGILDDLKALQKSVKFGPEGFVDLAREAEKRGYKNFGLRALTAIFLGQRLSKAAKLTNWDRSDLTQAQLNYAACDAYVGVEIYKKMFL